ncbi:MAG TPA: hypothetical protein VL463_22615, partial [Kofleriaceae bacterium]|nr:hypothetical protein [Kofleriaceae bacterium]
QFVAERKRLAAELKTGDKAAAKALMERRRPTVSAWAVDQLHWQARAEMDAMFDTAARLRKGKLDAQAAHRDAMTALRVRAASIIEEAGHTANEATLRKVTNTLAALAAAGGWDPDAPGTLAEDREAPGFGGMVGVPLAAPAPAHAPKHDHAAKKKEQEQRKAERDRIAFVLKAAKAELHAKQREAAALEQQIEDLEAQLDALREPG